MWKNIVQQFRPLITIWRMRIACWIPKATNTHSEYVTLIASPPQQWLHERLSIMLHVHFPSCFLLVPVINLTSWSKPPYFVHPVGELWRQFVVMFGSTLFATVVIYVLRRYI